MQMRQRACALGLALAALFVFASCGRNENQRFDEFLETQFRETLESDYVTMHILTEDPSAYGVDRADVPVNLGARYDEESRADSAEETGETLDELMSIRREGLSEDRQETYDLLLRQLTLSEEAAAFDGMAPVFDSMSGLHYQIPTMFADWLVRSEQDAEDLILLVEDVQPYVQSALDYTVQQQQDGLLMLDLDSVIEYSEGIVEAGTDSAVLDSMCVSIEALGLDDAKTQDLTQRLTQAFETSFLPAYQAICDTMTQLKAGQNNELGLSALVNGREYYSLLMKQSTGSDKSVDEIRALMEQAFQEHALRMQSLAMKDPSAVEQLFDPLSQPRILPMRRCWKACGRTCPESSRTSETSITSFSTSMRRSPQIPVWPPTSTCPRWTSPRRISSASIPISETSPLSTCIRPWRTRDSRVTCISTPTGTARSSRPCARRCSTRRPIRRAMRSTHSMRRWNISMI